MILGFFTLLIAIAISAVSAYYSILGLVAIFAAAALPVIIMGSVLEAGKIMTAVWLHRNWSRSSLAYKLYLVPSVMFLMLLTSLSVFGFLSKAHLDQGVPTSDIAAQIELIDTKISTQRENINAARKVLTQMDGAVDEVLARSKTEQGARNANTLRNQQAKDRAKLQDDIGKAQKEIATLNEHRAVVAKDLRKVEAEVGPVKYVAALIYGDNPDANLLEKAVRWVIILIVAVFDPLAIVLILAGSKQVEWALEDRRARRKQKETIDHNAVLVVELQEMVNKFQEENTRLYDENDLLVQGKDALTSENGSLIQTNSTLTAENERLVQLNTQLNTELEDVKNTLALNAELQAATPDIDYDSIITEVHAEKTQVLDENQELQKQIVQITSHAEELVQQYFNKEVQYKEVLAQLEQLNQDQELQSQLLTDSLQRNQENEDTIASLNEQIANLQSRINEFYETKVPETASPPKYVPDPVPETAQPYKAPETTDPVLITRMFVPTTQPEPIVEPTQAPRTDFGTEFPTSPGRGDMFLRTDFVPSRLFKWNDQTWIQINKSSTDVYAYNEQYIAFLIQKLQAREYEWDDLSSIEQQQVEAITGGPIG